MSLEMKWNFLTGHIEVSFGSGIHTIPIMVPYRPRTQRERVFYCTTISDELLSFQTFLFTTVFSELLVAFPLQSLVKLYRFHFLILRVKIDESTRLSYSFTISVSKVVFPSPHFVQR